MRVPAGCALPAQSRTDLETTLDREPLPLKVSGSWGPRILGPGGPAQWRFRARAPPPRPAPGSTALPRLARPPSPSTPPLLAFVVGLGQQRGKRLMLKWKPVRRAGFCALPGDSARPVGRWSVNGWRSAAQKDAPRLRSYRMESAPRKKTRSAQNPLSVLPCTGGLGERRHPACPVGRPLQIKRKKTRQPKKQAGTFF